MSLFRIILCCSGLLGSILSPCSCKDACQRCDTPPAQIKQKMQQPKEKPAPAPPPIPKDDLTCLCCNKKHDDKQYYTCPGCTGVSCYGGMIVRVYTENSKKNKTLELGPVSCPSCAYTPWGEIPHTQHMQGISADYEECHICLEPLSKLHQQGSKLYTCLNPRCNTIYCEACIQGCEKLRHTCPGCQGIKFNTIHRILLLYAATK